MRGKRLAAPALAAAILVAGAAMTSAAAPRRALLIGASIGRAWDFPAFPERARLLDWRCEYVGVFQFDKTAALRDALSRAADRPDVVILKECAAYFPGELPRYERLVIDWVGECRRAGVVPVVATVAPVVAEQSPVAALRRAVKRLIGRPDRNERIAAYNDWLRAFAGRERVALLDVEAAVRVSASDRSLRPDLHSGDGLHLNPAGYALLDSAAADLFRGALLPRN